MQRRLMAVELTIEAAGDAQKAIIRCVLGNPLANSIGRQVVSREEHLGQTCRPSCPSHHSTLQGLTCMHGIWL